MSVIIKKAQNKHKYYNKNRSNIGFKPGDEVLIFLNNKNDSNF